MLGEGPLFLVIIPIVAAIYFAALLVSSLFVGGFSGGTNGAWILDILVGLAVSPVSLGLYYLAVKHTFDTSLGHPAIILFLMPAAAGIVLGCTIGLFKRLFRESGKKRGGRSVPK